MTPIETQIEGIVDSILEDYRHGRSIDKLTPKCDPDKEIIIDMIGKLLRIVYPSYSYFTSFIEPFFAILTIRVKPTVALSKDINLFIFSS